MSNTKEPIKRQETPEERARRLRRQRMRREQLRRRRRKAMILRAILAVAAIALVIGLGVLISGKIRGRSEKEKNKKEHTEAGEEVVMEAADTHNVLHLSFLSLIADPERAFGQEDARAAASLDQSRLTVEEFNQILQQLYDQGYVLVSLEDLAQADENGVMGEKDLLLPLGKKPLIISQQNINYDLQYSDQGLASRLVLDGNGKLASEMVQSDGTAVTGAYDLVPCVEAFVEAHPDFSHDGARGILGITGYNGILGYRTNPALASSEGNKYASRYGVFDTAQETEAVKPVIEALQACGWEFACNGYGNISYASDFESTKSDMEQWKGEVAGLLGEVDILMYPYGADIGDWSTYRSNDEKYTYLKEQGFRYFCAMNISGPWTQMTEEYLRCGYRTLDGYRMYQDIYRGAGRFTELLDFSALYDQRRPSVQDMEDTQDGTQEDGSGDDQNSGQ